MRSLQSSFRRGACAASLLSLAMLAGIAFTPDPARADRLRDEVSADSFGNLVVWSRSGTKRIVVGKGHLAGELDAYVRGGGGPRVVYGQAPDGIEDDPYLEQDGYGESAGYDRRHLYHSGFYHHGCRRDPAFVIGHSYMYGLAQGELPVIAPCTRD